MEKVSKYRVWCNTDSKWEYWILEEGAAAPTTCPANTAHTIDTNKTAIVDNLDKSEVISKPALEKGGPSFMGRGFQYNVPAGTQVSHTHVFTEDLHLKEGEFICLNSDPKDYFTVELLMPDDTVAHTYVKDWCVANREHGYQANHGITAINLNGWKVKMTYKSHGATDVTAGLNLVAYTPS